MRSRREADCEDGVRENLRHEGEGEYVIATLGVDMREGKRESIVGGHLEARREKSDHCSPGDRRHFGLPVDRATVMV
jgi:hypothetical protein